MPHFTFPNPWRTARPLAVAALLAAGAAAADAAVLRVDSSGRLIGASDVVVNGQSYDVSFGDGSCIALMGGCDSNADFAFTTAETVFAASQALLAQVFNAFPAFDANPTLTLGCEYSGGFYLGSFQATCQIVTAYKLLPPQPGGILQVATHMMNNDVRDFYDVTGKVNDNLVVNPDTTLTGTSWPGGTTTWAVWSRSQGTPTSTVPEPGTAALVGLALAGLALRRRRRMAAV